MKPKAGDIHIIDRLSRIECGQLHFESIRVCWLDTSLAARFKVFAQTFVAKRRNHDRIIACCVVRNKSNDMDGELPPGALECCLAITGRETLIHLHQRASPATFALDPAPMLTLRTFRLLQRLPNIPKNIVQRF